MSQQKAVLFDLDGTLLPMDQNEFINGYFGFLVKKMAPCGYEPKGLVKAVWGGIEAMQRNDGSRSNEEAFWTYFTGIYGESCREHIPLFEEFYAVEFQQAKCFCGFAPEASELIRILKAFNVRTILATNPFYPAIATESRVRWAGLDPADFELITTYENIGYCKPNLDYYREILRRQGLEAENCLMVGNDTGEDMVAEKIGMKVFLLTDCLLNPTGADPECWPHGGFDELFAYLKAERIV